MTCRAQTVVNRINKNFPGIDGVKVHSKSKIFMGNVAEGGTINGLSACDYYAFDYDPEEKIYVFGVHKKLKKVIEDAGWFVECYDPGTYFAFLCNKRRYIMEPNDIITFKWRGQKTKFRVMDQHEVITDDSICSIPVPYLICDSYDDALKMFLTWGLKM